MSEQNALLEEIAELERRLQDAKGRLKTSSVNGVSKPTLAPQPAQPRPPSIPPTLHTLLLLSDSALPLGSFAFSSALESYLAHHPARPPNSTSHPSTLFPLFLSLSLRSYASISLPYLLTAHNAPHDLQRLDDELDASTTCAVARRASIAQGKALLAVWDRSFRPQYRAATSSAHAEIALEALASFSTALKAATSSPPQTAGLFNDVPSLHAHLAPLFGVLARLFGIATDEAAYTYLLAHARTLLSAAVRASVLGPYQAQSILASKELQADMRACIEREWGRAVEEAGQSVPVLDIWGGRHDLLYSRIFNS